jgi:hypothetical protein
LHGAFFNKGENMQLTLIKNTDLDTTLAYQVARTVYSQTRASSLSAVEAMTSMIKNISDKTGMSIPDIIKDNTLFELTDTAYVKANNRAFQMCVRVAARMLSGGLPDSVFGATRFHFADSMPDWAVARGYIADVDGLLFYL